MLYTLKTILRRLRRPAPACRDVHQADESWWCDPLSHPQVQRMSQRQIADLPFEPGRIRRQC